MGGVVQEIADAHANNTNVARALGLNTDVTDIELPRRFDVVAPPTCEEEVIRKLVEGKCSQGAMWVHCGAVAFNSAVMNKAGCAVVQADLDTKADTATGKFAVFPIFSPILTGIHIVLLAHSFHTYPK